MMYNFGHCMTSAWRRFRNQDNSATKSNGGHHGSGDMVLLSVWIIP